MAPEGHESDTDIGRATATQGPPHKESREIAGGKTEERQRRDGNERNFRECLGRGSKSDLGSEIDNIR